MSGELVGTLYATPEDFPATPIAEISESDARSIVSNLRDAGNASITLQNDAPVQPQAGNIIGWTVQPLGSSDPPAPCFQSIVQNRRRRSIDVNEESAQKTVCSGPGTLAVTARAPIRPPGGTGRAPRVDTVLYNWTHKDYDDSAWIPASNVAGQTVASAKLFWPVPWAPGQPDGIGSGCEIVGPSSSTLTSAPVGNNFLRDGGDFFITYDGIHLLYLTGDNQVDCYIDGKLAATAGGSGNVLTSGFTSVTPVPISLSIGQHRIAFKLTNWPQFGGAPNPTGLACSVLIPGFPPTVVWQTIAANMVITEYPADEPGMTPGTDIRLAVEQAQNDLGLLNFLDLSSFDDVNDSAGQPWAFFANVTAQVGRDTIYNLIQKLQTVYADIVIEAGTWRVMAYNWGTLAPPSGLSLVGGVNITQLDHNTEDIVADGALVLSDALGWTDEGTPNYAQGFLELGGEQTPVEIDRLSLGTIATEDHPKTQIDVAFETKFGEGTGPTHAGSLYPWWNEDFIPGSTGEVPDEDGSAITERWLGVSISETAASERAIVTVVAKERVQDVDERFIQQLRG